MPSSGLKQLDEIVIQLDAAQVAAERAWSAFELLDPVTPATLPAGWAETTLGEICEVNPRKPSAEEVPDDIKVSFVSMAAIDAERGAIVAAEVRTAGEVRKRFRGFREDDVLMAKITPSMENGKAAVASGLVSGYGFGTTELHVLRPFGGVLPEYIFFFLRRRSLREEAAVQMKGRAGQKRVPAQFLADHRIPLASPAAQAEIVSRLRELDETRQEGVRSLAMITELLEDFRATALEVGCLGGFSEPSSLKKRSNSLWEGEELPALPEGWEWAAIGEVAKRLQYGTSARSNADADSGVPNAGMANMREGKLDLAEVRYVELPNKEREAFFLVPGNVLFNRTNSPELVGKAALVEDVKDVVFASYLIRIEVDRSRVEPAFVVHWINSPWGRAWAGRVRRDAISQSNINRQKLAAMPLPLPPLAEQRAIVGRITELLDRSDDIAAQRDEGLEKLDLLWESTVEASFLGAFEGAENSHADADTALGQIELAGVEREKERTRRKTPRRRPRDSVSAPKRDVKAKASGERFDQAVADLPARSFSFAELRPTLDLAYDDAVALLFERLENAESPLRQEFDHRRGEMRLSRAKR